MATIGTKVFPDYKSYARPNITWNNLGTDLLNSNLPPGRHVYIDNHRHQRDAKLQSRLKSTF